MRARLVALAAVCLLVLAPSALGAGTVGVTTSIAPRPSLFGDVVHATLTIRADAVAKVQAGFAPFQVLRTSATHTSSGGVVVTTWRFDLQCLDAVCAPGPGARSVALSRSRVQVGSTVVSVRFPAVRVDPRATARQVASPEKSFLHPTTPPPPSYRFSPSTLRTALIVAALLLVLVSAGLLLPLLRPARTRRADEQLDPLARALALLRASLTRSGPDRRRALGLVARTLRRKGEAGVGQAASDLAWSEPEPDPARIVALAERIDGAP
jgi:hypothetical protein